MVAMRQRSALASFCLWCCIDCEIVIAIGGDAIIHRVLEAKGGPIAASSWHCALLSELIYNVA